jgi:uncharacterized protein YndB with AHSA1/START domain
MTQVNEADVRQAASQLPPLQISRVLHARRETVFKAWTAAEHVKRWFSPKIYTVPDAKVEPRTGGAFEICMRSPAGDEHWSRGVFAEFAPDTRLVIDMRVEGPDGRALFRAYTEVDFSEVLAGTRVDVTQTYTAFDPNVAAGMISGATQGWRETLDKLDDVVVRLQGGGDAPARSVAHGVFHLERTYDAPAERVWRALTDETAKQKWFGGTPGTWELLERQMDVRPGGRERLKGRWESGIVSTFDATYFDVIPNERLVYAYEMHMNDRKISVSLATMQLEAKGGRTTLKVSEQGAFLDGYDDSGSREQGTGFLLDALGASLRE